MTLQNVTGFQWTAPRTKAAALLADDQLTDEQIAEEWRSAGHPWRADALRGAAVTLRALVVGVKGARGAPS